MLADPALNIPVEYQGLVGNEIIKIYTSAKFANDKAAFVKVSLDIYHIYQTHL